MVPTTSPSSATIILARSLMGIEPVLHTSEANAMRSPCSLRRTISVRMSSIIYSDQWANSR